ncbi:MAG: hypothetical protein ACRCTY_07840 [Candidatus Adiutrix sp.]
MSEQKTHQTTKPTPKITDKQQQSAEGATKPLESDESNFDRLDYFKTIRKGILKTLGLPENTRPDKVAQLLEIRNAMQLHQRRGKH